MDHEDLKMLFFLLLWAFVANRVAQKKGFYHLPPSGQAEKPRLLFRDVFGVFTMFLLIQLLIVPFGSLLASYFWMGSWEISENFEHGWINIAAILGSTVGIILFCKVLEPATNPIISTQGRKKLQADLMWGSLSWLLCFPVVSLFALFFTALLSFFNVSGEGDQVAVRYLKQIISDRPLFWSSFWLIIFVVPFVEEALFRGFLQTWLRQKMSCVPAIALSSLIFAGFHFSASQGWHNIDLLAALFLLSCYMGIIYEKRGSIWASASLHMTFNAISEVFIVSTEGGFSTWESYQICSVP